MHDKPIDDTELARLGIDAAAAIADPNVQATLQANFDAAIACGVSRACASSLR